ncbi:acyl-CoA dehydrogenase family member 11-like [Diadema antillarum]|uniref:acyl-CoA dehydrogenase family member 11-like n=1 Tax=Diadema antillarum TaxID=105358 RepID=UPI003A8B3980
MNFGTCVVLSGSPCRLSRCIRPRFESSAARSVVHDAPDRKTQERAEETHRRRRGRGADGQSHPTFRRAQRGNFFQSKPQIGNVFSQDLPLRSYLRRLLPAEVLDAITPDLHRFGQRVEDEITDLARQCEENPPHVKHFDAWGNWVDDLVTSDAWKKQRVLSAEEGMVAIPYENKFHEWSRLYQAAKLLMYYPSSGLYYCPLAMTDGAAKLLMERTDSELLSHAYSNLTSRDPAKFWTSGQWMTEMKGGSDVAGGTETLAYPQLDGSYHLHGYKWFSSATDSDMAIALARVVDEHDSITEGTKGISLFYLETRNADGKLNGIEIQQLKNKLGTRQLPTAELLLDGTKAYRISEEGEGIRSIVPMLTLSRYHTGAFAASLMRRIVHYARDYSQRRRAFGRLIKDWPLHMQTLSRMEVESRGALALLMESARLLGRQENGLATEEDTNLLRLATPIFKLYTGKQAVSVCSEGLESFGGQGYIEDTGLPVFLRDAQVLPIWEGTTNILSLDVLRSILKSKGQTMETFVSQVQTRIAPYVDAANQDLHATADAIGQACHALQGFLSESANQDEAYINVAARDFAFSISRIYIGLLLLEQAGWEHATEEDVAVARRWCLQDMCPVSTHHERGSYSRDSCLLDYKTVMAGFPEQ